MKKIISFILLIAILFGFVPMVYADTTDNVILNVDKSTVNVGDTVTVTLKTAQKIEAGDIVLKFSSDLLEYSSCKTKLCYTNIINPGELIVEYLGMDNNEKGEMIIVGNDTFVFTFKAIKNGKANISTAIENLVTESNVLLDFVNKNVEVNVQEVPKKVEVTSVTLDKETASLKVGETTTLRATVTPTDATDKTVTWKSSDTSIATVSNGTVKAIKAGTTTITATAGTKIATCKITVTEKETIPTVIEVTSVTLDKTTASLKVGETTTIKATVVPSDATDKTVTWKSSDTSVATVSNGTITAVKSGTATITATAGTKTATCKVTITEKETTPTTIEVTSVTLDKTSALLKVGETLKLTATVKPSNATNKTVTWKSSDTNVATVSNGTVTAVKSGTATITATVDGKSTTCKITVNNKTTNNITGTDNTTAKDPIPQTGETVTIVAMAFVVLGVATISIIKYRKYRDI